MIKYQCKNTITSRSLVCVQVVTKDLVSTQLSAVCYYRIENLSLCYSSLAMVPSILEALMQVSDKEVLAHHTFTEILLDRKMIAQKIQVSLISMKLLPNVVPLMHHIRNPMQLGLHNPL